MNIRPNHKTSRRELPEAIFHRLVNAVFRRWPRSAPPPHLLKRCRIISHRGENDNRRLYENTLPAFAAAADAGVWGLEMDVRWTRDFMPVVSHDTDTRRLYGEDAVIRQMTLETLKREFPLIPTLAEVIARYGGRVHLMLEIKSEPYPKPSLQARRMASQLRRLIPAVDFHLMALRPEMFAYFDFLPPAAMVPIAQLRIDRFSRLAIRHRWGGVAGHYLLAAGHLLNRHHRLGQAVGTGFADSRRCLYREVNRGVDWIFSNRAAEMQAVCRKAAGSVKSPVFHLPE
jgi:glycerophosphoryl diester phosphodiesterase